MAMDPKQRKKIMIRVGAAIAVVLLLAGMIWLIFFSGSEGPVRESQLGESDSMLPLDPSQVAATPASTSALVLNPTSIVLDPATPVAEFSIMASGAPVVIQDVRMPQEMANALTIQNVDCPAKPAALLAGAACRVSVKLTGTQPVNTSVEVLATTQNAGGMTELKQSLAVSTVGGAGATTPNGMPVAGGVITDPSVPAPIGTSTIPAQASASAPPPANPPSVNYAGSGSNGGVAVASGPSLQQQMRAQYLQARRGGNINALQPNRLNAAPRSPYASWNAIGVQSASSSYPTDMSRVLTPDKAITAVLSNIIDTRSTVTAVAMVDRDVYGNNGRTVVIPRGTKLIGTVGESSERVGIAWKQLIRPDGVRFMFDAASGDAQGRGGIPGRINERLLQRYGYSLVPSAVAAGITAALGGNQTSQSGPQGTSQQKSARAVAAEILTEPLNNIAADIYKRKSSMPTQITVPAGTRITVWAVGDLRLKPMGETDEDPNQQQGQAQNGNSQRQGFQFQPQQQQTVTTRQPQQQPVQNGDGRSEGNPNLATGGTVDENGNYIPATTSAPKPGPTTLNTRASNSNFPTSTNPWK